MELFNLKTRLAVSSNLNTLLIIQKMIESKNPNHKLLTAINERVEEMEFMLDGVMEMSAELRLSRQRNFDLESLVSKLQNDLDVERKLNNNLMKGL